MTPVLALQFVLAAAAQDASNEKEQKKFDCLGDICLNEAVMSNLPDITVKYKGHIYQRNVTVCSGVVVGVSLTTGWNQTGFAFKGVLPEAFTHVGQGDGTPGAKMYEALLEEHKKEGWILESGGAGVSLLIHKNFESARALVFERINDTRPNAWTLGLGIAHPKHKELCFPN